MASLHKQAGDRPGFKLRFRDQTGRQRVLWLGQVSKRTADAFAKHVAELVRAASLNLRPDGDTEKWGNDLDGRHRDRLVALGLVAPQTSQGKSDAGDGRDVRSVLARRAPRRAGTRRRTRAGAMGGAGARTARGAAAGR